MAEGKIAVEFIVPETQRRDMLREIEASGGDVEASSELYVPGEGDPALGANSRFDPLIIIACVVATSYFLRQAVRSWHDLKQSGGTVIDFRHGRVRFYKLDSADRGTIVVMTDDAPPSIHRPDDGTAVIEQITRHLTESALPPSDDPS